MISPFNRGYNEYWMGLDLCDSPYDELSDACARWEQGWFCAQDEDMEYGDDETDADELEEVGIFDDFGCYDEEE